MRDHAGFIAVVLCGLVSIAAAIALASTLADEPGEAYQAWAQHLQTVAAEDTGADQDGLDDEGVASGLLLVVTDEEGKGSAFAVLTEGAEGTPLLAVLPGSLYDLLPGYGVFRIGDAMTFEGPELAALAVENALGVRIGGVLVVPAAELPAVLGGDVRVDLPNPLVEELSDGTIVRVAADGDLMRSPEVVGSLFVDQGTGETLAHLERQVATWDGVIGHVAADPATIAAFAGRSDDPEAAADLLESAGQGVEVTVVPVNRIGSGDEDGFEVDEELDDFVERRMPALALWSGERPRAEILNGNGRLTTTRDVAAILVGEGVRIVRTDNAERFDFETTVVLAQGEPNTDLAREVVRMLGTGELRLEAAAPSGIVDVSIIVGHDIPTGEG